MDPGLTDGEPPTTGRAHRSPRLVLLLALVGLAVVSLAAVLTGGTTFGGPAQRPVAEWQQGFRDCAGGVMTEENLVRDEVQSCFYRLMVTAIEAGQMLDVQTALAAQITETPDLFSACHTIGHKVGQHAFRKYRDIAKLIEMNESATCQYALGHGVLDGFAFSNPSEEDFAAAAESCVNLRFKNDEAHRAYKLCSDGLGHAAWTATKNVPDAVRRCAMLQDELGREVCGEGIVMQIYEPAGTDPSRDIDRAFEELPKICASWPDKAETLVGCFSGAGYIYTRDAWVLHFNRGDTPGARLSEAQATRMVEIMRRAAEGCRDHEPVGGLGHCLSSVAQQQPPSVYSDDALTTAVCSLLGEYEKRCREFRFQVS